MYVNKNSALIAGLLEAHSLVSLVHMDMPNMSVNVEHHSNPGLSASVQESYVTPL